MPRPYFTSRITVINLNTNKKGIIKKIKRIIKCRNVTKFRHPCAVTGSPQYSGSSTETLRFPVIKSPAFILS